MGWLWNGRNRNKSNSRPRVARAVGEAHSAHIGEAGRLGGATAVMERALWSYDLPSYSAASSASDKPRGGGWGNGAPMGAASMVSASATRRRDFGNVDILLERAENTARRLGRSRAEMWEEALGAWLETQLAQADVANDYVDADVAYADTRSAPRPWLFEARRQRVWGEIDETLGALRTA